ncbi:uncharacterized protein FIBRA_08072 [Fibroporia radiculosa]|uniref:DUF6699 domain-containing protein n=1 Tax=Fibroporia radiculosa TaxID=599839 RepID=J4IC58_9APHY|nr:uncharacterized protein FIBRA_08072 [Fibroporia radiculosa]CCM05836.1 predicted protein [Fibroporia radiculosa]
MTIMPSYLRNLFGGSSSSSSSTAAPRTHSRSRSSGPAPNIYAPPSTSSSGANVHRSQSYSASRSTHPSPLRYTTGADTRTTYGYGKRSAAAPYPSEPRPHVLRRESHKAREPANYAIHTPSTTYMTPPSSRSNSSSSLFGMGAPRSCSSDAGHYGRSDTRPPLRQNPSWQPGSSVGSTSSYGSMRGPSPAQSGSYSRPRTPCLHMHPLLAHTRLHHAPLTYDVTFTPSARTVLDRATHSAIPSHTLAQPATEPPMPPGARLVLRSHKFPWPVVVAASHNAGTASPGPRFTVGPPKKAGLITNLDVLYAVHTTLMTPVTPEEWDALGRGSKAQQKATRAYERRCTRMGGGWEAGVRRIDWLGEKTRLVGVEVDKSGGGNGTGKLVFSKA